MLSGIRRHHNTIQHNTLAILTHPSQHNTTPSRYTHLDILCILSILTHPSQHFALSIQSFCEDLTEGKFSFPIIHAINMRPNDTRLLNILRKRTEDVDVKRHAVKLMVDVGKDEHPNNVSYHTLPTYNETVKFMVDVGNAAHPNKASYQCIASYPINTSYQHTLIMRRIIYQHILSMYIHTYLSSYATSTHPINAPDQHTLSTHPVNTPTQPTPSTRPINTPYQHRLHGVYSINPHDAEGTSHA